MKNKGFTLIELVGTLVILSLMLLIITPAISNSLKKGVQDADKQTQGSIIMAAKNYFSDNKDKAKDKACVNLSDLQSEGYIDDVVNPSDGTHITGVVVKNGTEYEFKKDDRCPR